MPRKHCPSSRRSKTAVSRQDELQQKILDATTIIGKLNSKQSLSSVRLEQRENENSACLPGKMSLNSSWLQLNRALLQQDQATPISSRRLRNIKQRLMRPNRKVRNSAQQLAQQLEAMRDQQVDLMQKQAAAHNQQTFLQRSHEQALNQYQQHSDELKNVQERLENAQQNAEQQAQLVIAAQKEQQAKTQQLDHEKAQQAQLQTQYDQVQQSWYQALGDVRSCQNA